MGPTTGGANADGPVISAVGLSMAWPLAGFVALSGGCTRFVTSSHGCSGAISSGRWSGMVSSSGWAGGKSVGGWASDSVWARPSLKLESPVMSPVVSLVIVVPSGWLDTNPSDAWSV